MLLIFGQDLINFLFDPRYQEAGWIVRTLSAGMIILLGTVTGPIVLAFGNSYLFMQLLFVKVFFLLVSMVIGGVLFGFHGIVIGVACSSIFYYPFQSVVYRKYSVWFPHVDVLCVFAPLMITFVFIYLL